MPESPSRVQLTLTNDARLAAAAGGAVMKLAERAGLDERTQLELSALAVEICRAALPLLGSAHASVSMEVEISEGRLEIDLEYHGRALAWKASGPEIHGRVDSVESSNRGGAQRIVLVKTLSARPARR